VARVGEGGAISGRLIQPDLADADRAAHCITVRPEGPTQVVVVTHELLERLAARRPRIAARWGIRLVRILSRRLEEVVERLAALDPPGPSGPP
jgi:hypothetical protein